jgi:ABC-type Zn uptake system ZnuABC Zn-binding protein ZnuA
MKIIFIYQKISFGLCFGGFSMKKENAILISFLFFIEILVLTACSAQAEQSTLGEANSAGKLKVVATTTTVGDVIAQNRGEISLI